MPMGRRNRFVPQRSRGGMNSEMPGASAGAKIIGGAPWIAVASMPVMVVVATAPMRHAGVIGLVTTVIHSLREGEKSECHGGSWKKIGKESTYRGSSGRRRIRPGSVAIRGMRGLSLSDAGQFACALVGAATVLDIPMSGVMRWMPIVPGGIFKSGLCWRRDRRHSTLTGRPHAASRIRVRLVRQSAPWRRLCATGIESSIRTAARANAMSTRRSRGRSPPAILRR